MAGRKDKRTKVVVIGTGMVGSTFAYSLMINGVASEIVLIDANEERAASEVADLNHGLPFVRPAVIRTGEYADCADADVIVITAGAAQRPGETRLDLVGRNVKIFEDIIPRIVASGTHGVLVIASNPVDVMTYVTYKISGFPANQVIVPERSWILLFRYLLSHWGWIPAMSMPTSSVSMAIARWRFEPGQHWTLSVSIARFVDMTVVRCAKRTFLSRCGQRPSYH